jgi:hypothetical protein
MSDAPEPYVRRNANDLIRAADWNNIQIEGRKELRQQIDQHKHTGGAQGVKLTGEAIAETSSLSIANLTVNKRDILVEIDQHNHTGGTKGTKLPGDAIDPESSLSVKTLTVNNTLTVNKRDILAEIDRALRSDKGFFGLYNHELRLRPADDPYHGLRYAGKFANETIDGAALYGHAGGLLGVMESSKAAPNTPIERIVLRWDLGGLNVNGRITLKNGSQTLTLGARHKDGTYDGDAIYGTDNLWLDAKNAVSIKKGFQSPSLDVAERFPALDPLARGDVVVYDAVKRCIAACDKANDKRVVGMISTDPAFVLGIEQNEPTVALCGRVPCKVDADIAPIEPGDLLTSSPTRGHAQKADPGKATGAIIGKALEGLDKGRGEILVFVAMQ